MTLEYFLNKYNTEENFRKLFIFITLPIFLIMFFSSNQFGICWDELHIAGNVAKHPQFSTLSKAIISPYKEQTIRLEQMLPKDWEIDTVDSFQGNEKDVIYISLVRSNTESNIGFLRDVRRMNVALTRARHQLVVVGDAATLAKDPFYAQFIQYCEDNKFYHTAWEWM